MPLHTLGLITVWTFTFGMLECIPHGAKGSFIILKKYIENANCVFDKYINNTLVQS